MTATLPHAPAPRPDTILLCDALTITINGRAVIQDQTLSVRPGEVTVLMGPSGIGKSVLADVLFGLNGPHGAVRWSGRTTAAHGVGSLVFQAGGGLPHVTALDNVTLAGASANDARSMLQAFDLDPQQSCAHLSGGESRRLASARALSAGRRLLWLDEPAAGLDVVSVDGLVKQLREEARERQVAVVVTSHRASFTAAVADRIVFLGHDSHFRELGAHHTPEALEARLRDAISSAQRAPAPGAPARWRVLEQVTRPFRWIGTWPLTLAHALTGGPLASRVAAKTLGHALRIAAVEGAIFYVIVGTIFGAIFLLIFELSLPFMNTAQVVQEFGPTVIHRLSPAFAGVLAAARAGSAISAWIGQMSVTRQLDALKVLGVNTDRHVVTPTWLGLALASLLGTALFAGALAAVFGGYLHVNDPCAQDACLSTVPPLQSFVDALINADGRYAVAKAAFYGTVVAAITVNFAAARKRRPDEVATAITRGIVHATIWIMCFEVLVLFLQAQG